MISLGLSLVKMRTVLPYFPVNWDAHGSSDISGSIWDTIINGICQGKIEIPELHDIVPGAFAKHKGIGIKFKKLGYESSLIGGVSAWIRR